MDPTPSNGSDDRPITVADILPFLSERGQVEVRAAVAEFRLAVITQQQAPPVEFAAGAGD